MAAEEAPMNEVNEGSKDDNIDLSADQQAEGSDDEEDECRVCRGPAEEGRPLYAPCKCSGSIGMVHQDCLTSWLAVTRGDGRCELCKTKFRFNPKYAENTPDRLPAHEVFLGLSSRAVAKWLPFTIRFLIATSLWLVVAPLITTYLYHAWMHRPSTIMSRWKRDLLAGDVVSGAVIGAVIIISFLSLMSFADFLRVHWQQPQARRGEENGEQGRNDVANGFADDNNEQNNEGGIDDAIVDRIRDNRRKNEPPKEDMDKEHTGTSGASQGLEAKSDKAMDLLGSKIGFFTQQNDARQDDRSDSTDLPGNAVPGQFSEASHHQETPSTEEIGNDERQVSEQAQVHAPLPADEPHPLRFGDNDAGLGEPLVNQDLGIQGDQDNNDDSDNDERQLPALPMPVVENDDIDVGDDEDEIDVDDIDVDDVVDVDEDNRDDEIPPLDRNNGGRADQRFDPMDPVLQDDQVELEINVALDELLGLRGPFSTLIRNLLWLLAFNATYLGIFAFVPRTVGSAVYSGLLNTTTCRSLVNSVPYVHSDDANATTLSRIINDLNEESESVNTSFRLPDLSTVTLGYLSIAMLIVLVRYGWTFSHHIRNRFAVVEDINTEDEEGREQEELHDRLRREPLFRGLEDNDGMDPPEAAASVAVGMALDATVAVVKVGILLFLKMFLLPLLLGLWLDVSTMPLFGNNLEQRVAYAGSDLFSFILLHWVAGITFMLLVTVFLLQLREVAHPDLLARLIRPQEPQPDLLGNLMHESVSTHMKRMFLSLAIYAPLLMILISVPVKVFAASGIGNCFTFFRLRFWHIVMPQMQIPLELILFHLTMLALLERYKNSIGELQHHWLVFMCRTMGLTDHILPRSIDKFKLAGTKRVFSSTVENSAIDPGKARTSLDEKASAGDSVDSYWYDLLNRDRDVDDFILKNIDMDEKGSPSFADCETKANGEKVLSRSANFIRLPRNSAEDLLEGEASPENLLPTKIGSFRLKLVDSSVIQFWQEVPGPEIPRPPEGWDDLGAGGAFVQGRWAWGKEKKSVVEGGVAQRIPFRSMEENRRPVSLFLKVVALLVASWLAITVTVCSIVSAPLAVGRGIYLLFRIPDEYVHDPLAFVIGGCLFFPAASKVFAAIHDEGGDATMLARVSRWASRMHLPPMKKLLVFTESMIVWFVVAPLALGMSYEIFAVKSASWFVREDPFADSAASWLSWMVGLLVLNAWSFLASISVFTRDFWANIGNGILEPPDDNVRAEDAPRARQNGRNRAARRAEPEPERADGTRRGWQGQGGRAARFFNVLKLVIFRWEWEAVERNVLLDDFVYPIAKPIVLAIVGSSTLFMLLLDTTGTLKSDESSFNLPIFGVVGAGLFRMIAFRICMAFYVLVELCLAMRSPLAHWFQVAHKVARDDRYLIGEVLMNYQPETETLR